MNDDSLHYYNKFPFVSANGFCYFLMILLFRYNNWNSTKIFIDPVLQNSIKLINLSIICLQLSIIYSHLSINHTLSIQLFLKFYYVLHFVYYPSTIVYYLFIFVYYPPFIDFIFTEFLLYCSNFLLYVLDCLLSCLICLLS